MTIMKKKKKEFQTETQTTFIVKHSILEFLYNFYAFCVCVFVFVFYFMSFEAWYYILIIKSLQNKSRQADEQTNERMNN